MAKQTNYRTKNPDSDGWINYSEEEHAVWRDLFDLQKVNTQKYAADIYLAGLDKLTMSSDRIPQCREINSCLQPLTGWTIAPVLH